MHDRGISSPIDILPPPFKWCEIPAGFVTLEDASKQGGSKGGRFEVSTFAIAKYPITNSQYQIFVDAADGYRDAHWWDYSEEAIIWREEHQQPIDTAFPGEDLPRTNVSWYDAVAFCCWLSNLAVQKITLPTEQQWQRAAQGDDNRQYPWGNDINDSRCNCDGKIGHPTPVTQYPSGASPYGVMDMSGNVWEWCLTEWGTDASELTGDGERVLRGGSWDHYDTNYFRCASRNRYDPEDWISDWGFRLARS